MNLFWNLEAPSQKMPTIKELHELHLSQLDTTLKESELLLQREGGLDGELKTSGSICERFVRQTLQRFIVPGHFRITSGFVATPGLLRERRNLPQCDILIIDRDTLPLLRFEDSGIEVVPRESVCGIIEVKRSLTRQNMLEDHGALSHVASVIQSVGETANLKTDKVLNKANLHIGFHNHSSDKPLLGVIALQNGVANFSEVAQWVTDADSLIDFVWTLDGHAMLPGFQSGGDLLYFSHTARPETQTWAKLKIEQFQGTGSPFYSVFSGRPVWNCLTPAAGIDRACVFAKIRGVVSLMLSRVCSRPLQEDQINDYYLRGV